MKRQKHIIIQFIGLALSFVMLVGCNSDSSNKQIEETQTSIGSNVTGEVLSASAQKNLTPDTILSLLLSGNARFVGNNLTSRDHSAQIRNSSAGQFPKAIILSCVDSRVPVEDVFDLGIGDVFVTRVAGNIVNEDILGSMEFACKVSGSKVILVLGHENCGAVKATIDEVRLGNINHVLDKIKPALEATSEDGEHTSKNAHFVHGVCENNIKLSMAEIRKGSPILNQMEINGEIKIIGAVYDMDNGSVKLVD